MIIGFLMNVVCVDVFVKNLVLVLSAVKKIEKNNNEES